MTNEELTKKIAEKVKEIRDLYLKENPQGNYLSIAIWKDSVCINNSYYKDDSAFPIEYYESFEEKE